MTDEPNALDKALERAEKAEAERDALRESVANLESEIMGRDANQPAIDAMREDAERYRWLKDKCVVNTSDFGDLGIKFDCDFDHWNNVDAAIDAARKGEA